MYSREIVTKDTLIYFNGDNLAANVWIDKYCLKDKDGNLLERTPDDMHKRMAREFARIEQKYPNPIGEDEIYQSFKGFKRIVPQGRVMAGLGATESFRSLSNCLVLPSPEDSYSSIMHKDTMLVNAAKRGCGYGIDLSKLRPEGSSTTNAATTSTGIVPFMERYSNSTREVGQDSRRGACLLGLNVSHPDSSKFITAKKDRTKVTGANISLKIDDKFMHAVCNNSKYNLEFNGTIYDKINASDLWKTITSTAHADAEPGLFYWDRMTQYDPVSVYKDHVIVLTNACGEQPMGEFDSCRLILINLLTYVQNPFTKDAYFDFVKFYDDCQDLLVYGDDLVDLEVEYIDRILDKIDSDPEPQEEKLIELKLWNSVKEKAIKGRRVGCGLTALGDMLAALGFRYGSDESVDFIHKLAKEKLRAELDQSIKLAEERGPFPDWDSQLEYKDGVPQNPFYEMLIEEFPDLVAKMNVVGRRNINFNTIAPTGTTSLMTSTTSGCEPVFMPAHKRRRKVEKGSKNVTFIDQNGDCWEEYNVLHNGFKQWYIILSGCQHCPEVAITMLERASDEDLKKITKISPFANASAEEINWKDRINIQAALQKYTTSAISSTINLPVNTTVEEVSNIYIYGWKMGLKGQTIYRSGSRDGVLISSDAKPETKSPCFHQNNAPKRPKQLQCNIHFLEKKGFIVLVGIYEDTPYEVFAFSYNGKISESSGYIKKIAGGRYNLTDQSGNLLIPDITSEMNQIEEDKTRLISWGLRHGGGLKFLVEQLGKSKNVDITSFSKSIARVLKGYIKDGTISQDKCPNCGGKLIYQSGCIECSEQCGYSKCG